MIEAGQSPDDRTEIFEDGVTHERRTVPDPKANDCTTGDRNRANDAYSLAIQLEGRNDCDLDAGRSAMPSPAVD